MDNSARRTVFDERLELLVQLVQMIMARVQRVVFVALHQYLGLSKVEIKPLVLRGEGA
jgi:hypothetical protein